MSQLQSCPFCGSTDLHPMADEMLPDQTWWGHVECASCEAQGPGDGWAASEPEAHVMAVAAWNRRTLPQGMALVPREITAETGHKAGMIGDFSETVSMTCEACSGDGKDEIEEDGVCSACEGAGEYALEVMVSWTTIKAIHRRIVELSEQGGAS